MRTQHIQAISVPCVPFLVRQGATGKFHAPRHQSKENLWKSDHRLVLRQKIRFPLAASAGCRGAGRVRAMPRSCLLEADIMNKWDTSMGATYLPSFHILQQVESSSGRGTVSKISMYCYEHCLLTCARTSSLVREVSISASSVLTVEKISVDHG